jgi:DNA-binding transcriptional ArsR family regulator
MMTKAKARPAPETFEVTELEQLRVLADPLRLRVLNHLFQEALTVKQVADRLEVPATKLYYHVNELERIGLVKVVETRVKSGIIEKYYRLTAPLIHVSRELLQLTGSPSDTTHTYAEVLASIFEAVADDLRQSVIGGQLVPPDQSTAKTSAIGRTNVRLTRATAARLAKKFAKLLQADIEAADDEAGEVEYGFALAFFPIKPVEGEGADE